MPVANTDSIDLILDVDAQARALARDVVRAIKPAFKSH